MRLARRPLCACEGRDVPRLLGAALDGGDALERSPPLPQAPPSPHHPGALGSGVGGDLEAGAQEDAMA